MPKVHFVKKARKDNPAVKKGESYYWWAFMQGGRGGPKRYSATPPKGSQLTQSEFYQAIYSLTEDLSLPDDSLESLSDSRNEYVDSIREIAEQQEEKFDNLPESLQGSATGELLEERRDACEAWAEEVESIEIPESFDADEHDADTVEEFIENLIEQIHEPECEV